MRFSTLMFKEEISLNCNSLVVLSQSDLNFHLDLAGPASQVCGVSGTWQPVMATGHSWLGKFSVLPLLFNCCLSFLTRSLISLLKPWKSLENASITLTKPWNSLENQFKFRSNGKNLIFIYTYIYTYVCMRKIFYFLKHNRT